MNISIRVGISCKCCNPHQPPQNYGLLVAWLDRLGPPSWITGDSLNCTHSHYKKVTLCTALSNKPLMTNIIIGILSMVV